MSVSCVKKGSATKVRNHVRDVRKSYVTDARGRRVSYVAILSFTVIMNVVSVKCPCVASASAHAKHAKSHSSVGTVNVTMNAPCAASKCVMCVRIDVGSAR